MEPKSTPSIGLATRTVTQTSTTATRTGELALIAPVVQLHVNTMQKLIQWTLFPVKRDAIGTSIIVFVFLLAALTIIIILSHLERIKFILLKKEVKNYLFLFTNQ